MIHASAQRGNAELTLPDADENERSSIDLLDSIDLHPDSEYWSPEQDLKARDYRGDCIAPTLLEPLAPPDEDLICTDGARVQEEMFVDPARIECPRDSFASDLRRVDQVLGE